eukprot:scaffold38549_cov33-Prasinocladus_malaysianus.AAC.1
MNMTAKLTDRLRFDSTLDRLRCLTGWSFPLLFAIVLHRNAKGAPDGCQERRARRGIPGHVCGKHCANDCRSE